MPARSETGGRVRRATRAAGLLPLVAGVTSALALTGAAVYTVDRAGCGDPAQYIRHDNYVELVGGCVDGSDLPGIRAGSTPADAKTAELNNYRP
ncbi:MULTISPECIES: hypothetical protein [Amycolatopsis]|uniref:Secreted protein n=1 Tax=Amycolatopsis thermalba TaxID=944492 RepID=A0ABY4P465_9PSEU|nr:MULTISPECIES: hypothetical protein [Amycolatopsis]OXM73142.1 hypothetical protein CF166_11555 [Amycolatopsis sp. KNN50.9b]UQS27175.1 hypothetical protein L1857_32420 [Amycolatopsis thermalba]